MTPPQSQPQNEAAERLRHTQRVNFRPEEDVDLALAEERRHVIEQIRERLEADFSDYSAAAMLAILDELALTGSASDLSTPPAQRSPTTEAGREFLESPDKAPLVAWVVLIEDQAREEGWQLARATPPVAAPMEISEWKMPPMSSDLRAAMDAVVGWPWEEWRGRIPDGVLRDVARLAEQIDRPYVYEGIRATLPPQRQSAANMKPVIADTPAAPSDGLRAALKRIADWGWDQSRKPGDDPATIAEMAETALAAVPATEGLDPNAMTPVEELDNFEGWADPATEGLDPHPRTYSLVGSPHLFLVTDDESGINIGYADKIGGPLVRARLSSPEDQK